MKNRQVANNKLRLPSFDTARYFAQKVAYLIGFLCGPQRRLLPKLTFCAKATARYEKRYQCQTQNVRCTSSNGLLIGFLINAQIKKCLSCPKPSQSAPQFVYSLTRLV